MSSPRESRRGTEREGEPTTHYGESRPASCRGLTDLSFGVIFQFSFHHSFRPSHPRPILHVPNFGFVGIELISWESLQQNPGDLDPPRCIMPEIESSFK